MQSELPESVRRAVCEYGAAAFNSGTAPDDAVATTDALTAREGAFAAILAYGPQCREAALKGDDVMGKVWEAGHAMGERVGSEAERAKHEARIAALEAALTRIAEGAVETRYARDDMQRALYHIDGVQEFAKAVLTTEPT